jgi:hypothetical protein
MPRSARLTPRRGRPRDDVKQVKIPETAYKMLYAFAEAHNLTFGDAAAYLIGNFMQYFHEAHDDANAGPVFRGTRKQVKIPKSAHTLLWVFAEERSMTLGDAAALMIALELMRLYKLDEDAGTRQKRIKREKKLRSAVATPSRIEREERQKRERPEGGPGDT